MQLEYVSDEHRRQVEALFFEQFYEGPSRPSSEFAADLVAIEREALSKFKQPFDESGPYSFEFRQALRQHVLDISDYRALADGIECRADGTPIVPAFWAPNILGEWRRHSSLEPDIIQPTEDSWLQIAYAPAFDPWAFIEVGEKPPAGVSRDEVRIFIDHDTGRASAAGFCRDVTDLSQKTLATLPWRFPVAAISYADEAICLGRRDAKLSGKPSDEFVAALAQTEPSAEAVRHVLTRLFSWMTAPERADLLASECFRVAKAVAVNKFSYIRDSGMYLERATGRLMAPRLVEKDLQSHFGDGVNGARIMRALDTSSEKFDSTCYLPEQASVIVNEEGQRSYNVARPFPVRSRKDWVGPMLAHLEYLVPNDDERRDLLQWMSHAVKSPEQRCNWAVVLISPAEGTGKDTIAEMMCRIIGEGNYFRPTARDVEEGRGTWLANGYLQIINEALFGKKVMEGFKSLVTEDLASLRFHNAEPVKFRHNTRFFFISNHDSALAIGEGSRRFYVIKSEVQPKPADYYRSLRAWMNSGYAVAAFRHYLEHEVDMEGFSPWRAPGITEAHKEMAALAQTDEYARVARRIEERLSPFQSDLVVLEDAFETLYTIYEIRIRRSDLRRLLRAKAVNLGRCRYKKPDDEKSRRGNVWALANVEQWAADGDSEEASRRKGEAMANELAWHQVNDLPVLKPSTSIDDNVTVLTRKGRRL